MTSSIDQDPEELRLLSKNMGELSNEKPLLKPEQVQAASEVGTISQTMRQFSIQDPHRAKKRHKKKAIEFDLTEVNVFQKKRGSFVSSQENTRLNKTADISSSFLKKTPIAHPRQ
mmetsp:Transcript_4861/g.7311  ORF Transcript_4861/g.7311 Transcript_4861/m.7311 type:complete len:115 (+) Transcript_4861:1173-1517(+)